MNNATSTRLFLRELLRRLDFPRVILEPDTDAGRAAYFAALEGADRRDFQPLVAARSVGTVAALQESRRLLVGAGG